MAHDPLWPGHSGLEGSGLNRAVVHLADCTALVGDSQRLHDGGMRVAQPCTAFGCTDSAARLLSTAVRHFERCFWL
jgi:hypothetical protein